MIRLPNRPAGLVRLAAAAWLVAAGAVAVASGAAAAQVIAAAGRPASAASATPAATAPQPERIPATIESMWQLARLADPAVSPDGRLAVVPVTRYDVAANVGRPDLWLVPVAGGPARQLTSHEAADAAPAFSPDGRWIAFVSKRGDDEESQVYVIPVGGGEARRVTSVPVGAGFPKWFPDSRRIAFVSEIWNDLVRWEDQAKRRRERLASKVTARTWDRAPIAYWDRLLDDREPHLFSIAIDGGEPQAITRLSGHHLTRKDYGADDFAISPDGLTVAFVADTDPSGIDPNGDVIVIPACGCKPARNVTADNPANDFAPQWSPDGRQLVWLRQSIKGFYGDTARPTLLDLKSGTRRTLAARWDRSVSSYAWSPDGRSIYAPVDDAGTQRVYRIDVADRAPPRPLTRSSSFSGIAVAGDALVALRQGFTEPATLVRVDPRTGAVTKLTTFDDDALERIAWGRVESVSYPGARDEPVQMWIVYPPDFDPSRAYPLLLLLHGGPHNGVIDAMQWRWNAQVFAAWGYVVAWHNFHGSSGFGQAFADSINPDRISMPYEDTIRAAAWFQRQPWIDSTRMAAAGASFGGFLAAAVLGREHPFQTIVAHAAVYDEFTQHGADFGAEKSRFFAFWERPEEFARYSPHTFAGNFRTPTLVSHGQLDQRVPVNQGVELFNTLQKRGVPSRLVYFPDENHWILKPQNSVFWYHTVQDWLAKYAAPGPR